MGKKTLVFVFLLNSVFLFASTFVFLKKDGNFSLYAYLTKSNGILLTVKAKSSTKINTIKKRYANSLKIKVRYKRGFLTKRFYIRYEDLKDSYKKIILKKLFPHDYIKDGYYYHKVRYKGAESLWRLAVWFTGDGMNYKKIKKINRLRKNSLYYKVTIRIPKNLLLPCLRPKRKKNLKKGYTKKSIKKDKPVLQYGKDSKGEYAIYRLKKGEALYSSVVVRFTGRLEAKDVMELAYKIAKRSGIKDVKNIPSGYPVKIPLEYLLPEYLPKTSRKYKQYESDLKESAMLASEEKIRKSENLDGVYLIIDAGHGGIDTGANYNGVWEDDYVYDIMCRIIRIIKTKTKAFVFTTIYDKSSGYKVFNRKKLKMDNDEFLWTTPNFSLNTRLVSTVGVNLRWYIANYINNSLIKKGVPSGNIVFISLHADALYKKVRGTMVYIPYSGLYRKKVGHKNRFYLRFFEVKSKPFYYFTKKEVQLSEGLSRNLARNVVKELKANNILVHKDKPIREFIFRAKYSHPFVPAVIRNNKVKVKMLIEVANLKNKDDAKNMADPNFRERFAESIVKALIDFYSK